MNPIGSKRYETVVCYDMQLDNGGDGGNPKVILSLRVVEGDNVGENFTSYHFLTEKAAPYTMKALKALGWTGTKISKAMSEGLGTRKASAKLIVQEYKGKVSEKVDGIYEPKVFGPKNPIEANDLDAFDALFEGIAATAEGPTLNIDIVKAPTTLPAARAKVTTTAKVNPNELGW